MSQAVYILDAVRTPLGRGDVQGALHELRPLALLGTALRSLQGRSGVAPDDVGLLLVGVAEPIGEQGSGLGASARRQAGWCGGAAAQVSRQEASGLEAVALLAAELASAVIPGQLAVAAAVDAASRVPTGSAGGPLAEDPATVLAGRHVPAGVAADLLATHAGLRRPALDSHALRAHQLAAATKPGRVQRSTVPVCDDIGLLLLDRDELVQPALRAADLARCEPAYAELGSLGFDEMARSWQPALARVEHPHTRGNIAPLADGAAAFLLGTAPLAGSRMRAKVAAWARVGRADSGLPDGALRATQRLLAQAGLSPMQIDLYAVGDRHAAQPLYFIAALGLAEDRVDVYGGVLAHGLAPAAGGLVLLVDLLDALADRGLRRGVVALDAGGEGIALLIEREQ
jgi:acetyl-CoA C-acetyltransferase